MEAPNNIGYWLARLPIKKGASPLRMLPSYEQWAIDLQTRAARSEYWLQHGYAIREYYAEHSDVPTVYFGAWYDSYARATTENFIAFTKLKKSSQRLIMGPWTHGIRADEEASGEAYFGPEAIDTYNSIRLRWFDTWLKGLDTGVREEAPVRIFVMGGGSAQILRRARAQRPHRSWRPLARRKGVAAGPRAKYSPLFAFGRHAFDLQAGDAVRRYHVSFRSRRSCTDDWRKYLGWLRHHSSRRFRPAHAHEYVWRA
jgi:hypothetical protein